MLRKGQDLYVSSAYHAGPRAAIYQGKGPLIPTGRRRRKDLPDCLPRGLLMQRGWSYHRRTASACRHLVKAPRDMPVCLSSISAEVKKPGRNLNPISVDSDKARKGVFWARGAWLVSTAPHSTRHLLDEPPLVMFELEHVGSCRACLAQKAIPQ